MSETVGPRTEASEVKWSSAASLHQHTCCCCLPLSTSLGPGTVVSTMTSQHSSSPLFDFISQKTSCAAHDSVLISRLIPFTRLLQFSPQAEPNQLFLSAAATDILHAPAAVPAVCSCWTTRWGKCVRFTQTQAELKNIWVWKLLGKWWYPEGFIIILKCKSHPFSHFLMPHFTCDA